MERSSRYNLLDPELVDANRRGEIAPAQRAWLRSSARPGRFVTPVLVLIGGVSFCVINVSAFIILQPSGNLAVYVRILFVGLAIAGGIVGTLAVLDLMRLGAVLSDPLTEPIEQARGKIVWAGKNYVAQLDHRRLKFHGSMNLPPGDYRFFYLADTGRLLSVEKLAPDREKHATLDLLNALAQANRFDLEAIVVNRLGELSKTQVSSFKRLMLRRLAESLILAFLAITFLLGLAGKTNLVAPVIVLVASGAIGCMVLYSLLRVIRIFADVRAGQVVVVEGLVHKMFRSQPSRSGQEIRTYYYQINGMKFEVSQQGYHALIPGLLYRLYYVPHAKEMVSVEPLSSIAGMTEQPMP